MSRPAPASPSPPWLVVLDMAGTTVGGLDGVSGALEDTFRKVGIHLPAEAVRAVRGRAKTDAIRELLAAAAPEVPELDEATRELHGAFVALLRDTLLPRAHPLPGIPEAIQTLRSNGCPVVLATGFDRETVTLLLERLGWMRDTVDGVVTADDVAHGRPAPDLVLRAMELTGISDPDQVVVAGDTVSDLECARRAGVRRAVGVLSGAHDRATLEGAPHAVLLPSVAELPGWLLGG